MMMMMTTWMSSEEFKEERVKMVTEINEEIHSPRPTPLALHSCAVVM